MVGVLVVVVMLSNTMTPAVAAGWPSTLFGPLSNILTNGHEGDIGLSGDCVPHYGTCYAWFDRTPCCPGSQCTQYTYIPPFFPFTPVTGYYCKPN
ncbi:hypothetical protein RND81_13G167000 [Saponaria officinalis]